VNHVQASRMSNHHPMWETIWKLRVPAKVKIFIWRTMQNTIPCRSTLANRHVKVSGQCPICLRRAEDVKHLLFLCPRAKQIWEQLGLNLLISEACEIDRAG
jgi:hypothetical protein